MAYKDRLPETYAEYVVEGGTESDFETIIGNWVAAGGNLEESALRYLIGTRRLKATRARINKLSRSGQSAFKELDDAVYPYLPPL